MKSPLQTWIRVGGVATLAAGLTMIAAVSGASGVRSVHPSWTASIHVVAGPVAAGGMSVVLVVNGDGTLHLEAVRATGQVAWSEPYNSSYINAGTVLTPLVIGGVAIDLHPAVRATSSGLASVRGITVATGKVAWTRANVYAADVPVACDGGHAVCMITVSGTGYSYTLLVVNPVSGAKVTSRTDIFRDMTPGFFEMTTPKPTATVVSDTGHLLWTKTFASLFGGPKFDPGGGWYFRQVDGVIVGSVGDIGSPTTPPSSVNVGNDRTIGIQPGTGKVLWNDPGMFECMGALPTTQPVICRYSGSVQYVNYQPSFAGVTLTLEGVSPTTGRITWSKKVTNVAPLSEGISDRVASGQVIEVTVPGAKKVLLNLVNGTTTSVSASSVLWCENPNTYTAVVVSGDPYNGKKAGVSRYNACNSSGASAVVPATGSRFFGAQLGAQFDWPSTHGLSAAGISSN